ncbi:MAG TPA: S41 family peptidase [Pyrinomonadaceae bacterium]|jgi:C-terminal processing protease CtpA/Prc
MRRLISCLFCVALAVNQVSAQSAEPLKAPLGAENDVRAGGGQEIRLARLAGLAKIWGAVKYFHPYPAYRAIDWDGALVEAIPRVNASRTAEEYLAAVNGLLAALGDKNTRAEFNDAGSRPRPRADQTEAVSFENGVLFINARRGAFVGATEGNQAYFKLFDKIVETLPRAKAIVIDGRAAEPVEGRLSYFFDDFVQTFFRLALDREITLGTRRYRLHSGYAPQTGQSSGGFYSSFVTDTPATIRGTFKSPTPPAAFIVNEKTPAVSQVLGGLQAAGKIFVVQDGDGAEPGIAHLNVELPGGITARVRTTELVNPDGSVGVEPDSVVAEAPERDAALTEALRLVSTNAAGRQKKPFAPAALLNAKEKPYEEMNFPSSEYRLLALFRFWNVINYFFPYKNLIGRSWDEILPQYIAKFEANRDAADYQLTVREMVAEIRDSHGSVRNANALSDRLGRFAPPVALGFVERRTVVTKVLDGRAPLKIGETVLAIDGEPIEKKREYFARLHSASTPQSLMRSVHFDLLRGQKDSPAKITLLDAAGKTREITMTRSFGIADDKFSADAPQGEIVRILPGGFGYVDLSRLQVGQVDAMFETVKNAPAVVFDMRGYPNGTAWDIAPRLTPKRNVVGALFSRPLLEAVNAGAREATNFAFAQYLPEPKGAPYTGKVVMLIDERAVSQSEGTALFFEAATDVTFIGTPTTGANGDVTRTVLPGNLIVNFTGHDVRHADGRQLQRIGIEPHLRIEPTVAGMKAGKDEILEAAIEYLTRSFKKKTARVSS